MQDARAPALHVGEDAMHPRQEDVRGHVANHGGTVRIARGAGVAPVPVGDEVRPGRDGALDEALQRRGFVVRNDFEPNAARARAIDLDGTDDHDFSDSAASLPAGDGIGLRAEGDRRLVDLDIAFQKGPFRVHHRPAELVQQQPRGLV